MDNDLLRTAHRLKNKYRTDELFKEEYDSLLLFYLRKFSVDKRVPSSEMSDLLTDIEECLARQFAQGFTLINAYHYENPTLPLIVDKTTKIDVLNTIPSVIYDLYKDNGLDCTFVESTNRFAIEKLSQYGAEFYDKLNIVFKEMVYYGMLYSCIELYNEHFVHITIDNLFDIAIQHQLTPQTFIVPVIQSTESHSRSYELFSYNLPDAPTKWLGRVTVSPYDSSFIHEILLSDYIAAEEKNEIIEIICANLPFEKIVMNILHVSNYHPIEYTRITAQ